MGYRAGYTASRKAASEDKQSKGDAREPALYSSVAKGERENPERVRTTALKVAEVSGGTQRESASRAPLATYEEGLSIVQAIREYEYAVRSKPDCSHLVHNIYEFAGFAYHYATSIDLYAGIENFAPVQKPQPGDLIVWRGHVGIVVNPVQRSFYSSVRGGLSIDFYDSRAWVRRGRPRLYRYVRPDIRPGDKLIMTAERTTPQSVERAPNSKLTAGDARPEVSLVSLSARAEAPALHQATPGVSRASLALASHAPVISAGPQPTPDEVATAILKLGDAVGGALQADEISKGRIRVVIFERLRVERMDLKGEHGWAEVRIDSKFSIAGGRVAPKRSREKLRWGLQRAEQSWSVVMPRDTLYAPRDAAVRSFAEQLAALTRQDRGTPETATLLGEQAHLAQLLNTLLENK